MENKVPNQKLEKASFAAGCFWGVQYAFDNISGVKSTVVGYMGGHINSPTYEEVCGHKTGHAEAVEILFDPKETSYNKLLDEFWKMHDPTTLNKQGSDVGDQYRSAVFFYTKEQEELAQKSKEGLEESGKFKDSVVTEVVPASTFYRAEEYHQKYFEKTGQKVCH